MSEWVHSDTHTAHTCTCTCTCTVCDVFEAHNTCVYRIAGNIGGELYLADWRVSCHTANIKSANIAPTPGEGVAIVP